MMHCYKIILSYDGTHFSGWQRQPNGKSIQQCLEEALKIALRGEVIPVRGSGRTDAGVHAKGQAAHFRVERPIDPTRLLFSMNGLLPPEIRVISLEETHPNFHAQYSAISKEYHYYLHLDAVMCPFLRNFTWHVKRKIDLEKLKEAACFFEGTHDFTSFANESFQGSAAKNAVRTLYRLQIFPIERGVRLEFEGDGFLYKMVRNIVGTLVDIASEKRGVEQIPLIFDAKDRRQASQSGSTAWPIFNEG